MSAIDGGPSCPLCGVLLIGKANRLVTDSCGHRKCRSCLLAHDECTECLNQEQNISDSKKNINIVFEESQNLLSDNYMVTKKKVERPSQCHRTYNEWIMIQTTYYHLNCGKVDSKKYKCQQCEKAFSTKSHYNYHLETHAERTYYCKHCKKAFTNRIVLQKHERSHSSKSFQCTECDRQFRNKESLSGHFRKLHDGGDLPYKCEVCHKTYALKSTLKQHMHKHFDKRYACRYCDKRFQRNYTLTLHLKKHSKTDCFICGICFRKFSDSSVLLRHVKLHEDGVKYRCRECDATIMRKDNMKRHIRTIHPGRSYESCVDVISPISTTLPNAISADNICGEVETLIEPKLVENSAVIKCIGNVQPMTIPKCKNASTILNKRKTQKHYDPIKLYRKILTSDYDDESANESESEKEEVYNKNAQNDVKAVSSVGVSSTSEKRVTCSTSNFSEMHWRKNFKYTYEYQE
ncbi:unnamed protein product [Ceratitis capitata]|uniref:(Mediterranean fruit fly) hypothetical protein n=1 Tax=Ceratitis capitata TaxID=7213 RepID=A0A811U5E6_CERCA|nr:unnamed protein product [Ceratitis capitata]